MRTLAFIPARGGSKGIPRKNLAPLAGKPLVQHTIEAAKKCSAIDRIFLSSDDPEVLDVGRKLGVKTDYQRPEELAGDRAQIVDAALHALDWLEARGEGFDTFVLLQPTSPLRTAMDISESLSLFAMHGAQTLVSVHRTREHPYECLHGEPGRWDWVAQPPGDVVGRQDYAENFYFLNGAIYITRSSYLRECRSFIEPNKALFHVMPAWRGIDIDEPEHLQLAEWLLSEGSKPC